MIVLGLENCITKIKMVNLIYDVTFSFSGSVSNESKKLKLDLLHVSKTYRWVRGLMSRLSKFNSAHIIVFFQEFMMSVVTIQWTSLVLIEWSFTEFVLKLSDLRPGVLLAVKFFTLARNLIDKFQLYFVQHIL